VLQTVRHRLTFTQITDLAVLPWRDVERGVGGVGGGGGGGLSCADILQTREVSIFCDFVLRILRMAPQWFGLSAINS